MNTNNMLFNMLLGRLRSQNPQAYQQFMGYIDSGQSPEQILNKMLMSGQISQQDINNAKNIASQYNPGNNTGKRF